jgi:D-alanyl-D-alanine carboxypeptidase
MITATLIFQLIEQNKLHLEDKLSLFYPNIPNAHKITIKNLLEHSSGLGDYTLKNDSLVWLTQKVNEQAIFNEIIKQGVSFQPSTKFEYSNSGYFLLTKIVEKLFEQDYATAVATKISRPLQLTNLCSITDETKNIFDSYHFKNGWEKIKDFEYSNVIGVGDIVSTTKDLNTLLYHLFQYKILQAKSVALMKPDRKRKIRFGKGLKLIPFYDEVFYGHGGDTYGTHSLVAYNEKDQIGICFAINGERFPHNDFAIGILSIIYGKDYEFPIFNTIALSSEELDKFVGVYSNPDIPLKLLITKDGTSLSGQLTGESSFPLECYATNKFKFDPVKLKLEFSPEEKKLILSQDGQNVELKKE